MIQHNYVAFEVPYNMTMMEFQSWATCWMLDAFGPMEEIAKDRPMRFFEEACELAQATDLTRDQAHQLVDYVYAREPGEVCVEIGDVLFTLAGLSSTQQELMGNCAKLVRDRAEAKRDKIIEKRKMRPTDGSALPTKE